jgi:hypothetical protein
MTGQRNEPHEEPAPGDDEFARQLASVLRASEERPGVDFDERVMAAVRSVHSLPPVQPLSLLQPRAGWGRQRTLSLPPMAWGALAAGFAIMVSLGTLATAHLVRWDRTPARPIPAVPAVASAAPAPLAVTGAVAAHPARHDTVYMVRFVLADANAHTVSLVGDFNDWAKHATPLTPAKPGVWTAQVALPAGRHEYAFVVDGQRWVADPAADRVADDFDTPSSVVTVGPESVGGI